MRNESQSAEKLSSYLALAYLKKPVTQQALSFTSNFSDPNPFDALAVTWDFGDGSILAVGGTDPGARYDSSAHAPRCAAQPGTRAGGCP